jgi:microcystin-dependent protein
MSDQYLGEIRMFGGNFAPAGWALCNGQLLQISQNTALFAIIGTYYGGNGVNTFALPNLQSRVPVHQGQGPGLGNYVIGEMGGVENVTLTTQQMPLHGHVVNAVGSNAGTDQPSNAFLAKAGAQVYSTAASNATMAPTMIGPSGGSTPHPNIQPFLCVTFIIALTGIFPTRN